MYSEGKLIVENKGAKFGTVYFTRSNPRLFLDNQIISILAGRTLVKVELHVSWSLLNLFSCCKSNNNDHEVLLGNDNLNTNFCNQLNLNENSNNISYNVKLTENTCNENLNNNNKHNINEKIYSDKLNSFDGKAIDDSVSDVVLLIENIPLMKDKDVQITQHNSFI
jgi:hypothetical protein